MQKLQFMKSPGLVENADRPSLEIWFIILEEIVIPYIAVAVGEE